MISQKFERDSITYRDRFIPKISNAHSGGRPGAATQLRVSTWTELFDLGFWETPPTRGRSPFSYNYMMNLIVSTYLLRVRRFNALTHPIAYE